ncbi:hypothetical protein C8R45DRAFT_945195 [Mycena sanguinolenta]|nr:hypothetical protein C8R45DRAFT_945195 [Mycena sanguinolenta]
MLLTLILGMNIIAAKIKPKPVCLMPSDKRLVFNYGITPSSLPFVNSRIYCHTRAASKSCATPAFEYFCSRMAQKVFGTAAWALIYTQIQAQARKSPLARAQARLASRKVNSREKADKESYFVGLSDVKNGSVLGGEAAVWRPPHFICCRE